MATNHFAIAVYMKRSHRFWINDQGDCIQGSVPKYLKFEEVNGVASDRIHPVPDPAPEPLSPYYPPPFYPYLEVKVFNEDSWEWLYWYEGSWLDSKEVGVAIQVEADLVIRDLVELGLGD